MKLHCPECKSTNITPIVETTNNGGYAVNNSITRNTSVSNVKFNSTHRNFWMCSDCGNKFRNIQNLQDEIASENKKQNQALILLALVAIVALLSIIMGYMSAFGPVIVILGAVFLFTWLASKKKVSNMTQELAYLKEKCFN